VDAVTESEVLRLRAVAVDVECLGVVEGPRIAVGRCAHQEDGIFAGIVPLGTVTSLTL